MLKHKEWINEYLLLAKNTKTITIDAGSDNLTEQFTSIIRNKEKEENTSLTFYGFKSALHRLVGKYYPETSDIIIDGIQGIVLEHTFKAEEYPVSMTDKVLCISTNCSDKDIKTVCFFIEFVRPRKPKME